MSFDFGTIAVLMLAAALAGLLIGILPVWRRLMGAGHRRLPVWLFLIQAYLVFPLKPLGKQMLVVADLPLNFHPAAARASANVTPFGAMSVPA